MILLLELVLTFFLLLPSLHSTARRLRRVAPKSVLPFPLNTAFLRQEQQVDLFGLHLFRSTSLFHLEKSFEEEREMMRASALLRGDAHLVLRSLYFDIFRPSRTSSAMVIFKIRLSRSLLPQEKMQDLHVRT